MLPHTEPGFPAFKKIYCFRADSWAWFISIQEFFSFFYWLDYFSLDLMETYAFCIASCYKCTHCPMHPSNIIIQIYTMSALLFGILLIRQCGLRSILYLNQPSDRKRTSYCSVMEDQICAIKNAGNAFAERCSSHGTWHMIWQGYKTAVTFHMNWCRSWEKSQFLAPQQYRQSTEYLLNWNIACPLHLFYSTGLANIWL